MYRPLLYFLLFSVIGIFSISCQAQVPSQEDTYFDEKMRADIIFFFKEGKSHQECQAFVEELMKSEDFSRAIDVLYSTPINRRSAYSIRFRRTTTDIQKAEVRRLIESSAVVGKIFFDRIPSEVDPENP